MIGLMRLLLASSALLIIYLDPAEPDHLVQATYAALFLYVLYSLILYIDALSRNAESGSPRSWAHWADVGWYTVLISLSSGTNSIFFFFYLFSILVASFTWGFRSGAAVSIVSTLLFGIVGYLTAPADFDLNRFLLRPIYLLVLGYMIAYWGGFEVELRRRLKFLRDITRLSNPRFGVERTIAWCMDQFLTFYQADTCLLITSAGHENSYDLRRVRRESESSSSSIERLDQSTATDFLSSGPTGALLHRANAERCLQYDLESTEVSEVKLNNLLKATLGNERFLSVPVSYHGGTIGRLYIVGGKGRFVPPDAEFVLQAIDQVMPVLDNIRLVDHLATDAAERERERIARDIHDSIIQPYIGLQLGLAAISQKIEIGDQDVLRQLNELSELTAKGISDLRRYVGEIKTGERSSEAQLLAALRRFCSRFSQATAIEVEVLASEGLSINDRLAGEVFQMITEGLSNIRRHTNARFVKTELSQSHETLVIRIENENRDGDIQKPFSPRSMTERAASLGGQVSVETNGDNSTVVVIEIPL
jgi:signal transduction histidine kinase